MSVCDLIQHCKLFFQFPKLLFADEIRVNMTLLSDPENRRGYGTGVIEATSPYRVECEYTPRKDQHPEPFCSDQHALTYQVNSEGQFRRIETAFLSFTLKHNFILIREMLPCRMCPEPRP